MRTFAMTWFDHADTVAAARRKVMTPSVRLPEPLGHNGKLPPPLMLVRHQAHQDLLAALQRLSGRENEQ